MVRVVVAQPHGGREMELALRGAGGERGGELVRAPSVRGGRSSRSASRCARGRPPAPRASRRLGPGQPRPRLRRRRRLGSRPSTAAAPGTGCRRRGRPRAARRARTRARPRAASTSRRRKRASSPCDSATKRHRRAIARLSGARHRRARHQQQAREEGTGKQWTSSARRCCEPFACGWGKLT